LLGVRLAILSPVIALLAGVTLLAGIWESVVKGDRCAVRLEENFFRFQA
jgi:hypothetical protein